MLDPKRYSPTGTVDKKTGKDALLRTRLSFQQMVDSLDAEIKQNLVSMCIDSDSHFNPASFPSIYNSGDYVYEIYDINSFLITNSIRSTLLPSTDKIVINMETKQKEKERLQQELIKVENAITDYESKTNDDDRKKVIEDYYNKGSRIPAEIEHSNGHRILFGLRGEGYNHNVEKMKKNDDAMDRHIAAKQADPDNVIANAYHNINLNVRANRQGVLRGRKIRAEAEQKVILLSHALKVKKYQKKAAKFEAKRDAALSQGNNAKADVYQAKVDNLQKKIDKPISSWGATKIILKESAKDLFRIHRGYQDYRPWEVRRAEALEQKVNKSL